MVTDHHFPQYHVRPPSGYVNDPNGPVLVNGTWHLYFQYVPDTPRTGPVVWGHATSADLATWRLHRPAISPHPDGVDRDGCWSGNAVEVGGEITAFYSGFRRNHTYQSIVAATSVDGGQSFGPPRQVVDDPGPDEGIVSFRDPFVWRENDRWLMVVGAGNSAGLGLARLYESADLANWTYAGPLAELPPTHTETWNSGEIWECPQLVSFDDGDSGSRDALLVGSYDHAGMVPEVLAVTGVRKESRLEDLRIDQFDVGSNFYAPSAARDSEFGPIAWGWVTEGRDREWTLEADWSGCLTLPRVLRLTEDRQLASAPVPTLTSLRREVLSGAGADHPGLPAQFEAEISLTKGHGDDGRRRISLHCGPEHLDVIVDWTTGRITIDRDHASADPRAHTGQSSFVEPDLQAGRPVTLRWFVDGSISELFTGSGRCSTVRFYPTTPPPWTVTTSGLSSDDSLTIWALRTT